MNTQLMHAEFPATGQLSLTNPRKTAQTPTSVARKVEHVGIRRHMAHRPCRRLLVTSVVRHLLRQTAPVPEADVVVTLGSAGMRGRPAHIAEVLHRLGMAAPAY